MKSLWFYAIRHIKTGELMPESKGRGGYSFWSPGETTTFDNSTGTPRLFLNEEKAKRAVGQWVLGIREIKQFGDPLDGYSKLVYVDMQRQRSDVEVIKINLTFKE